MNSNEPSINLKRKKSIQQNDNITKINNIQISNIGDIKRKMSISPRKKRQSLISKKNSSTISQNENSYLKNKKENRRRGLSVHQKSKHSQIESLKKEFHVKLCKQKQKNFIKDIV